MGPIQLGRLSADYYHLASDGSETLRGVETTRTDVHPPEASGWETAASRSWPPIQL